MNAYTTLARMIEFLHIIVIIVWLGGFAFYYHYPKFRFFHTTYAVTIFFIQLIFGCRCPLTLLSGYLMEMANPGFTNRRLYYKPFIIELLKKILGLNHPK